MSFDLFVGHFTEGTTSSFHKEIIEEAFKSVTTSTDTYCLTVCFDKNNEECSYIYRDGEHSLIDSFSINRPVRNINLFKILLGILSQGNFVLYLPGNCPPLVGSESTISHIPHDMVDALGTPVMLKSADEIIEWIQNA